MIFLVLLQLITLLYCTNEDLISVALSVVPCSLLLITFHHIWHRRIKVNRIRHLLDKFRTELRKFIKKEMKPQESDDVFVATRSTPPTFSMVTIENARYNQIRESILEEQF